jgi:hypothetical protein
MSSGGRCAGERGLLGSHLASWRSQGDVCMRCREVNGAWQLASKI